MSRIELTELLPEMATTVGDANATLTSWNAGSLALDDTNFRDGGLDRRPLGLRSCTPSDGRPTPLGLAGPSAALAATGVATQVAFGATLIEIGPINFNAATGDQLKVLCSFNYTIAAVVAGCVGEFSLGYGTASGGPWTLIGQTRRPAAMSAGLIGLFAAMPERGSCTIAHKFTAATSTTLHLALLYTLTGAATLVIDNLTFSARLRAR
jgi:hypothetical protein